MKVRQLVLGMAAVLGLGANAQATIIIPTNFGNGADAEVREDEPNLNLLTGFAQGSNRGGSTELATRKINSATVDQTTTPHTITNYFPTNDRGSVMYLKFDISSLPASGDSFWDNHQVSLRLSVRQNNNITGQRLWNSVPDGDSTNLADYRLMQFGIKGLNPNGTYSTSRTDRMGNAYTASNYAYDWTEGAGNGGADVTGITYYNAPGLRPHCVFDGQGVCSDAGIPNSNDSVYQTLGIFDDWDENVVDIEDTWHWPNEQTAAGYTSTTTLPANLTGGTPIDYADPNGNLKQLLLDAKAAGMSTMTLIVYHNLDGQADLDGPTGANVGINGTTPANFLNFNYLVAPKNLTTLPSGTVTDNSTGALSPQLRIFVPEPASVSLLALAALAGLGLVRRRK